ncbi:hypothetical protein PTTG_28499 [Puccinia triticina 1-1 BBBD Race 1]|uniref:DASH complex subunit DAD4 n=2 Tax=Puccinia triticina TaxID=208348 RepID=A0A180GBR0_PUCT1|nr:uncharacterized protein PtA15_4A434 [Puccinia triticina]OAV89898.1 hypothetical protein PTTG_28499 [Puccinia triticina 1-1 BBBD Race 1]WAQ83983.1 hypothetical protein PtA15_4A434 [Puccinia triticina]WAR54833.1 hypothetical protein PtB15_4B451 [Puccinia triticina]
MQNPFEEQQTALLSRMLGNVEKLSEAMTELILSLESINHYNLKVSDLNQAVQNYALNVKYNLQNQNQDDANQGAGDHNNNNSIDPAI